MSSYTNNNSKSKSPNHETIVREVRAGNIKPIYYLMGEESYYIDRVAGFIVDSLLKPEERDFNLITFFGAEADIDNVIGAARGFPMGAHRLVVVVKEAQHLRNIERLEYYFKQIPSASVLIFCHKNGTIDRRKKVASLIEKYGVLYESKKIYENMIPTFIYDYLRRKGFGIEASAAVILAESVGADLNRMAGELDKLCVAMVSSEKKTITSDLVEKNIGISKNYNVFELQDALSQKDVLRANRICNYFEKNPREFPLQKILPSLFRFYSNLMMAYYAPEKSKSGISAWLGITEWQVKNNVLPAMSQYTGVKVMNILSEIRKTDARSKGVGNPSTSSADLLRELVFYILH